MKILLHICCGICAAGTVERLFSEGNQVFGFFYNPNIYPPEEYQRRLEIASQVAQIMNFALEITPYQPEEWLKNISGLEGEPEGGKRCEICFHLRLGKSYLMMQEQGLDVFTTTLTISPHKSAQLVNRIGQEIGGDRFLVRNFKKLDGFKHSVELAKKWHLYRQHYCGCLYSMPTK